MFFILFNILVLPAIFLTFTGIAFSVALCLLLSHYWTRLFSSFRDYTFLIFLMGLFFQKGIRFLYAKLDNELLYWPLYVLSILLALHACFNIKDDSKNKKSVHASMFWTIEYYYFFNYINNVN